LHLLDSSAVMAQAVLMRFHAVFNTLATADVRLFCHRIRENVYSHFPPSVRLKWTFWAK
jgi:hypothetical protein